MLPHGGSRIRRRRGHCPAQLPPSLPPASPPPWKSLCVTADGATSVPLLPSAGAPEWTLLLPGPPLPLLHFLPSPDTPLKYFDCCLDFSAYDFGHCAAKFSLELCITKFVSHSYT